MKQKHTSLLVFHKEFFVRRVLPAIQTQEMHQQCLSSLLQGWAACQLLKRAPYRARATLPAATPTNRNTICARGATAARGLSLQAGEPAQPLEKGTAFPQLQRLAHSFKNNQKKILWGLTEAGLSAASFAQHCSWAPHCCVPLCYRFTAAVQGKHRGWARSRCGQSLSALTKGSDREEKGLMMERNSSNVQIQLSHSGPQLFSHSTWYELVLSGTLIRRGQIYTGKYFFLLTAQI